MGEIIRTKQIQKPLTRRQFLKASAVGLIGAVVASCSPSGQVQPDVTESVAVAPTTIAQKKTLTVGIGGDVPGIDVLEKWVAPATTFYYAMWDSFMEGEYTQDGTLIRMKPMLATEWNITSDDHLTWEIKLREGIKFHNGEEWNADAAAFSINQMLNSETSSITPKSLLGSTFDSVSVVDKYTIHYKTTQPFVIAPLAFAQLWPVPPAYYQDVGSEGFAEKPVGIGQYRFVEWRKAEHIVIERNPDYWGEAPTIDEIIFKPIPEDATRVAALEAGEVDFILNVPPDDAKRLSERGFEVPWTPIGQAMNLTEKTGSNPAHPLESPINDKRVRQAMNYAVDLDSLVSDIMLGYGRVLQGQIVGPSAFGYNPDVKRYPYDPDKAKQLLAEAGYPDGFTMKFDTSQGRYVKHKEVSEWLVGEYAKVGITLEMEVFEWSAFIDKVYSEQSAPVFYTGRNWYPIMDDEQCIKMYECAERRAQMCEPEFETLISAERAEFDPEKRKLILHDIHKYLWDYAPVVYLFEASDIFAHTKEIKNFKPTPDNRVHLPGVTIENA